MTLALQTCAMIDVGALACGKAGGSADPYGFTRMLMEDALERIEAARELSPCEVSDWHTSRPMESAVTILRELRADLDLLRGGTFAANADDLYDYMCRRLRVAAPDGVDRTAADAALDEVAHLLEALRCAWNFMPAEVRRASGN